MSESSEVFALEVVPALKAPFAYAAAAMSMMPQTTLAATFGGFDVRPSSSTFLFSELLFLLLLSLLLLLESVPN